MRGAGSTFHNVVPMPAARESSPRSWFLCLHQAWPAQGFEHCSTPAGCCMWSKRSAALRSPAVPPCFAALGAPLRGRIAQAGVQGSSKRRFHSDFWTMCLSISQPPVCRRVLIAGSASTVISCRISPFSGYILRVVNRRRRGIYYLRGTATDLDMQVVRVEMFAQRMKPESCLRRWRGGAR